MMMKKKKKKRGWQDGQQRDESRPGLVRGDEHWPAISPAPLPQPISISQSIIRSCFRTRAFECHRRQQWDYRSYISRLKSRYLGRLIGNYFRALYRSVIQNCSQTTRTHNVSNFLQLWKLARSFPRPHAPSPTGDLGDLLGGDHYHHCHCHQGNSSRSWSY